MKIIRSLAILTVSIVLLGSCFAQTTTPALPDAPVPVSTSNPPDATPPSPSTPTTAAAPAVTPATVNSFYAGGLSWNVDQKSDSVAGTALWAYQIAKTGTYTFTMIDAVPVTTNPLDVNTDIGVGIGQKLFSIGPVGVFIPTTAGVSYTGSNVGWAWSTGAGFPFRLNKDKPFFCMPTFRFLKSSVSNGAGIQPIIGMLCGVGL